MHDTKSKMNIYAFIVTYNRLQLLKKTIQCLREQTINISQIVIINNSSTDGTEEWLKQQKGIFVITQPNSGGAGGFYTGVKFCMDNGAEWIWMMDDDVFPRSNCLEELLKYKDESLCLQASRITKDGIRIRWNYSFNQGTYKITQQKPNWEEVSRQETYKVETGCFEGMLIHRSIVNKIGYPMKEFFIAGDDILYGNLASKHTPVLCIKNAIIDRYANSYDKKYSPMYTYYSTRNIHLLLNHNTKNNDGYTIRIKILFLIHIVIVIVGVLKIKECHNKKELIKAYLKGYIDSIKQLSGNTFK